MARRRRRRIGDSQEHLLESGEELADEDDEELEQMVERMNSIEAEIREISLSAAVQAKDTQSMRARMEQFARDLKEMSQEEDEGEDELVEDFERLEKQVAALNQTQAVVSQMMGRLESGEYFGPALEAAYARVEELRQEAGVALDQLGVRVGEELDHRFAAYDERLGEILQQLRDELGSQMAQGGRVSDEVVGQTHARMEQITRQADERLEQLRAEVNGRFQEMHAAVAHEFEELTERLGQELNQTVRAADVEARIQALTAELEVAITDLRAQLEAGVSGPQLEEVRQALAHDREHNAAHFHQLGETLNALRASVGDADGLAERTRSATEALAALETRLAETEHRYRAMSSQVEEAATIAARVNVATRALDALEERLKGGGAQAETLPADEDTTRDESDLDFELTDLLQVMIKHNATDLHLKVGTPPMVRLDGELIPVGDRLLGERDCRRLVYSAMSATQKRQLLGQKHVDFAYNLSGIRFRINAFMERGNISAAFRALRAEMAGLDDLGLPPILKKLATLQSGLVLVTGPTGSGKSTTLTSLTDYINQTRKVHVITIEDSIEFYHQDKLSLITQREVGSDTPSYAEALQQALNQDPNVIVVSELRDAESVRSAVVAASTGHLVLAGMSAFNAVGAIDRILDSFATGEGQRQIRQLLAASLRGVAGQRLLNRADHQGRVLACEVILNTPT
ncbi:MAG: PilT/PilU family type 4a pilus ATPase, partial [Candidatus Eremiobacterota bacterium]